MEKLKESEYFYKVTFMFLIAEKAIHLAMTNVNGTLQEFVFHFKQFYKLHAVSGGGDPSLKYSSHGFFNFFLNPFTWEFFLVFCEGLS